MDHGASRLFQQSLCESRSVFENLEPASARLLSDLQKQITKLKGDVEVERQKSRYIAKESLGELKRQRDEYERRLEQSLDSLNLRKDQEKTVELKRLEDHLTRQKDQEKKLLIKEKNDEMRELQKKLQKRHDENIKVVLKQQRELVMEEMQGKLPDEEAVAARESKLARELFSLGEENWKLEDQIRNLTQENRTQIDLMRRMKQEHESELTHFHRQNKTDAARDMAKLRLAEQIIQEKDHDLMEVSHQAGYAQMEVDALKDELVSLKSTKNVTNDSRIRPGSSSPSLGAASSITPRHSGVLQKRLEDLEGTVRKLEEEKAQMKMENASLRKKVVQGGGDSDSKSLKEADEKTKRLRKRNADLVGLAKTLEERCRSLKLDNDKLLAKRTTDSLDSEHQLRKTLSRQHAKDISDYTKQINAKEKENLELRRRLSKYEVSSGVRHDSLADLKRRLKIMAQEKLQVEKLVAKLYALLPEFTDLELYTKDYISESTHLQEMLEENVKLKIQLQELKQPNEGDADSGQGGEVEDTSGNLLADLREENQRLSTQLQQVSSLQEENEQLTNELSDLKLAHSFAERRLRLLEEDLEQAKLMSQEHERVQDLYNDLEKEVAEARGLLNERDQDICHLELENRSTSAALLEKEEEITSRNSQVQDLRQVLLQKEESLHELEEQLQMIKPLDTAHVGLQTNLSSPKSSPKSPKLPTYSPKTSPLTSPKTQSRRTSSGPDETQSIPESSPEKESYPDHPSPEHSLTAHKERFHEYSNLHAELQAAGMDITDPYDSEGFSGSVGTGSNVSLDDLLAAKTSGHSLHSYQSAAHHLTSHPPPVREEEEDPSPGGSVNQLTEPATSATNGYEPSAEPPLLSDAAQHREGTKGEDEVDGAAGAVDQLKEAWVLSDEQEDDDIHSYDQQQSSSLPPPPPEHLELTRQLVEGDSYCLVVQWQPPLQLPRDTIGYKVFVNDSLTTTVDGAETGSALLSNVPKNKHIKISVHTVALSGESDDPTSLIEINPEFPETPTRLELSLKQSSPLLLQLAWTVSHYSQQHQQHSTSTVQSYQVFINRSQLVKSIQATQLHTTQTENDEDTDNPTMRVTTTLSPDDFAHLTTLSSSVDSCVLTVRACGDHYMSAHSQEVDLPPHFISDLLPWTEEPVSDEADSDGRDCESYEEREEEQRAVMSSSPAISSHQLQEGVLRKESMDEQKVTEVIEGHYYVTLYTYDPSISSPNDDAEDVELDFVEGDIIVARGDLDEDGFFEGDLYGRVGLVPCNMVEHITDAAVLADIDATIATLAKNRQERTAVNGHAGSFRLIRAVCNYNPAVDSPNKRHDDELQLEEGDVLTVLGGPDIDGFYEAELKGRQGIVAKSLVEPVVESNSDEEDLSPSKSRTEVSPSELSQVKA